MKRYGAGMMAAAVLMAMTSTASGQARTISSEMRTETATIEAIDSTSRAVSLRRPDGTYVTVVAGPEIKRFAEIKVGDKVNARYYENVIVRLMTAGEAQSAAATRAATPSEAILPGGTKARQVSITATISAIDMNTPSVTFTGPRGWKYSSKVEDKAALAKVKVGDQVEIVWTEAMLLSIEPGK
jgi:Cu/Ag efflux protein CusF